MTEPARYLISACLCGRPCRYNGVALSFPRFERHLASGLVLPVCPELLAGLGVPRPPCEIRGGRVYNSLGTDLTDQFRKGAALALDLALTHNLRAAILKDRSPSCGVSAIYDGSFGNRLVPGQGFTTALLRENGIAVFNEVTAPTIL